MKRHPAVILAALLALFLAGASLPARGEVLPTLDERALREALSLVRGPAEQRAKFLRPYRQGLAENAPVPYASAVEVFTPFRLVVERALVNPDAYDFSQARADYKPKDDRLGFEVTILLPPAYVYNLATPLGTDWVIRASQKGKLLKFIGRDYRGLYTGGGSEGSSSTMIGAQVRMNYDMAGVKLDAPVTVEIISPEGERQEVEFDLADLR